MGNDSGKRYSAMTPASFNMERYVESKDNDKADAERHYLAETLKTDILIASKLKRALEIDGRVKGCGASVAEMPKRLSQVDSNIGIPGISEIDDCVFS